MINWSTLIKKFMQTYIVIVSGSILNVSTVHLNGIWHLIWRYLLKPVLGGHPVLSGHYSIPRGCPLNTGFTVLNFPVRGSQSEHRICFICAPCNNVFDKRFSYVHQACTVSLVRVFSACTCQPTMILRHPPSPHLWSKTGHGQRLQHCKDIIQHAEPRKIQGNVKKCLNTISAHMHIKVINFRFFAFIIFRFPMIISFHIDHEFQFFCTYH